MISNVRTTVSGLRAAARAVQISADAIVNANDLVRIEDMPVPAVNRAQETGDGKEGPFKGFRPRIVENVSVEGGGVVAGLREVDPGYLRAFAPGDPAANENGLVGRPNVDIATELVRIRQAKLLYMANVKALKAEDRLLGAVVNDQA